MEQDIASKIDNADIPAELKFSLNELAEKLEALLPVLSAQQRRRMRYMLSRLVTEVTDPAVEPHWWESCLDLMSKAANGHDARGQAVLKAVQDLQPLLRQQMGPYEQVTLREITGETVYRICMLSETLTEPKKSFVAENAISLAQAQFNKHAWFRAIYAGKAPVGFMMIVDNAGR